MSVVEMHSALARLYVDESFLESFCAGPEDALKKYDLTDREAAALVGIDRDAIRKFASSLRGKNRGRFEHTYRLLIALDEAVFNKYFLRFYELRPIQPYESFHGPILELGHFLERSFANNPEVPPYAVDLARYQRLFHQARFGPEEAVEDTAPPAEVVAETALDPGIRLGVAPGVRIERFGFDMSALEKALQQGEIPSAVECGECRVVFQSLGERGRAKKFQISAATFDLLSLCDGSRTLGEVGEHLEADWEAVEAGARKLQQLGLLKEVPSA